MGKILLPFKVLVLALKPVSKTADIWDWKDIINFVILGGFGGGGMVIQQYVNLEWLKISYVAFVPALLLLISAIKLQKKVDKFEAKPKPRIVFDTPYINEGQVFTLPKPASVTEHAPSMKGAKQIGNKVYVARVRLRNDPIDRVPDAKAEKALVSLDFYHFEDNETPFLAIDGRWSDNVQPGEVALQRTTADLLPRDLPPNGSHHDIDIVLKYDEDSDWYATNNDSWRGANPDGRLERFRLPTKPLRVCVTIRAVGMDKDVLAWFRLENMGRGAKPTIVPI